MVVILIKSSVTWHCVQQLFQAAAEDNNKALYYWPFVKVIHRSLVYTHDCYIEISLKKYVWFDLFWIGLQVFVCIDALINVLMNHGYMLPTFGLWSDDRERALSPQWGPPGVITRKCCLCSVNAVWWPIQWLDLCLFKIRHWLAVIVTESCPATNNQNNLKSPMWG